LTLLAFAERLGRAVAEHADAVDTKESHGQVIYTVRVGRQTFVVACSELAPDHDEPAV
jgi:hypothetical protein